MAFTAVEDTIGFLTKQGAERLWYPIQGFNGYEISDDFYLRSMKHYKLYPYGILIKAQKSKDGTDYYVLSDNSNRRRKMSITELMPKAFNNQFQKPRKTNEVNIGSRNQVILDPDPKRFGGEPITPKFTIEDDQGTIIYDSSTVHGREMEKLYGNYHNGKKVTCPIFFFEELKPQGGD